MSDDDKAGDGVRAVVRALDVLLAFSGQDKEFTAAELAQRVGLSRPTLYRLLYTMESKGFIAAFDDPQRFRLGPAVGRLSGAWSLGQDLVRQADAVLRRLWVQTQETVALWVRQGDMRHCVAELESPQALNLKRGVGSSERIARGASGRAMLAFVDAGQLDIKRLAKEAGMSAARFAQELETIAAKGYATSRDELIVGAVAVAAPVFDSVGVVGSIGVFGPAARISEREAAAHGKRVVAEARELSRQLGAVLPAAR